MRAAVLHTPAAADVRRASRDRGRAGLDAGPGHGGADRAARPAVCLRGVLLRRSRDSYVPGGQGVGVVESSESFQSGARVWFFATAGMQPGDGSLAETCVVPDGDIVPLEAGVPDELAAAVGLSGVAAWMALSWRARLQPGERVLVLGGSGAVGQVGIGAARVLGAESVVAVTRPASVERARAAGADVVVPLEGEVDALTEALAAHGPYDVVLDPVFGIAAEAASRCLAEHGRLVNLGGAGGDRATYSSAVLRARTASILGYTNNALTAEQRREAITAVLAHSAAGRIRLGYAVHHSPRSSRSGRGSLRARAVRAACWCPDLCV